MSDFKPDHRGYAIFPGAFGRLGAFEGNFTVKELVAPYTTVLSRDIDGRYATSDEATAAAYAAAIAAIDQMLDGR